VSAGLASNVVIKLLPTKQGHKLSFQRSFDDAPYDIPLLRWQERISSLRRDLPALLDPLRRHIGFDEMKLNESEIKRAVAYLNRVGFGMLSLLLEGTGSPASDTMAELAAFLAPVFMAKPATTRPIFEIEAATADDLAWRMPFEFLPIAPPLKPLINPRDDFERYLGFRAEIVRLLRGGPTKIGRDANGRVPVHLFAHHAPPPDPEAREKKKPLHGVIEQRGYLHNNTAIVSEWPAAPAVTDGVSELAGRLLSLAPPIPDTIGAVAHFACHYGAAGPTPSGGYRVASALNFGAENTTAIDILSLRGEFESRQKPGAPSPFNALFFLNACQTAAGGNYENSLLGFLHDRRATAILGSETLLPDPISGKFAVEFYEGLLRSVPLGKAVLRARRRLIERYNNPIGLFYTLIGNPLLQVNEPAS
jgi:hypothetical protein